MENEYPHIGKPEETYIEGIMLFPQVNTGCLNASKNIKEDPDYLTIGEEMLITWGF